MKLRMRFFAESLVTIFVVFLLMVGCEVSDEGIPDFEDDEPVAVRITAEEKQDNADDSVALEQPESSAFVRVGVDVLRLRSGPGTDYEILERLIYGTLLKVLDQDNEWLKIELTNKLKPEDDHVIIVTREGWVHSDYVIDTSDYTTPISSVDNYDPKLPLLISFWAPGDYYWSDAGCEFYFYTNNIKISFNTTVAELYEILGEPEQIIDKSTGFYEWELHYPSLIISLIGYDDMDIEEAHILDVIISSSEIVGPRGIKVGDSIDSLLKRVPNENSPILEISNKYEWRGEAVYYEQVIYNITPQKNGGPYAYIAYNESKEPLFAFFADNDHGSSSTGALIAHFANKKIEQYILAIQP